MPLHLAIPRQLQLFAPAETKRGNSVQYT